MTIFLSHSTAALYWLQASQRLTAKNALTQPEVHAAGLSASSQFLAESFLDLPFFETCISQGRKHSSDFVHRHLFPHAIPQAFLRITSELYVANPELSFLQAASFLDLPTLVEFGSYLCSTFATSSFDPVGFVPREALTSRKQLQLFLAKNHQMKHAAKATRALSYIAANNASPAEVAASLLVSLPNMYGGYGFGDARINYRVDITNKNAKVASKSFYKVDIAWPNKKIALEYDSDMFHANSQGIAADSKKRNALLMAGWHVIALTREQLYSQTEMDKVALVLRKLHGKRHLIRTDKHEQAKSALRKQLLFSGPLKERILQQAEAHF